MADLFDVVVARKLSGGGGGGGSSDFSTATVALEYTLPEGAESAESLDFVEVDVMSNIEGGYSTVISLLYGESALPLSDIGTTAQLHVPLYKSYPSNIQVYVMTDNGVAYNDSSSSYVISGDATHDADTGYFLITGDCTLHMNLILD